MIHSVLAYHLRKNWFLLSLGLAIVVAREFPGIGKQGGLLKPEVTVKYLAVTIIFLNSGLSIRTEELVRAVKQLRLHVYIQAFTLLGIPCLLSVVVRLLETVDSINPWLLKGLLVVGAMPPPVSSAVLLTKAARGNEAAAIFNSAVGSFLGIMVTPVWLFYFLGSRASVSVVSVTRQLCMTVVFPLIVGQTVRRKYTFHIHRLHLPFGTINSFLLLLIIFSTFCDTFSKTDLHMDGASLIATILLVAVLQCLLLMVSFSLSVHVMKLSSEDTVAALFCSTHKSLTLGIPILRALFSDHPMLTPLSVPLLVYHPSQILLGGLLLPSLVNWRENMETQRHPRVRLTKMV